ncbi:SapC family protein [Pseudoalteromonas ruthenica]|uniref:Multidrug transporter n=1 Tax=Pseudoalteromonas ruthenica TaxID=151081 RepID=A0A0F4PLA1_9GAMM|nr:SapC family protein [Pseudoalteromonas ruthenica]KJY94991.1 hypothetical protein TW76_16145 [Pseudoalteromonas ruthenica]KJY98672.1 hypothetical protein TW72_13190 [Pseudoalteromonas ruthenica]TMO86964.1 hypothetical protein CWC12_11970 [Pseudoalteromonas ruthenica]TMO93776.1 hypothetical protein CWC13_05840 [Pseudoalteromonas ruthenica]TMO97474.1 hypothetical protein CWC07_13405 [Pseudoalteromonas ruthenica]|tara:strand:- start:1749 stop:2450 length:702 start_codon:yes stop_codon:yes gene_type:complete
MARQFQGLNAQTHKNLRIKKDLPLNSLEKQQAVPVVLSEMPKLAAEFPLVFLRQSNGELAPFALFSLEPQRNNFVEQGKWLAKRTPLALFNQPLILSQTKGNDYIVAVDMQSELIANAEDESTVAMFNDDGSETEALKGRKQHLVHFTQQQHQTREFTKLLVEYELIEPRQLVVESQGEKKELQSFFVLNQKKLEGLSQRKYIELKKLGVLYHCYAMIMSLEHLPSLLENQSA